MAQGPAIRHTDGTGINYSRVLITGNGARIQSQSLTGVNGQKTVIGKGNIVKLITSGISRGFEVSHFLNIESRRIIPIIHNQIAIGLGGGFFINRSGRAVVSAILPAFSLQGQTAGDTVGGQLDTATATDSDIISSGSAVSRNRAVAGNGRGGNIN